MTDQQRLRAIWNICDWYGNAVPTVRAEDAIERIWEVIEDIGARDGRPGENGLMQFNALVAVGSEATHIESNLVLELERLLTPWKEGRFDWYAIGVTDWHFAAYLHPQEGWLDDDEHSPLDPATMHIPSGYAVIAIRCHG